MLMIMTFTTHTAFSFFSVRICENLKVFPNIPKETLAFFSIMKEYDNKVTAEYKNQYKEIEKINELIEIQNNFEKEEKRKKNNMRFFEGVEDRSTRRPYVDLDPNGQKFQKTVEGLSKKRKILLDSLQEKYTKLLKINPRNAEAYINRGNVKYYNTLYYVRQYDNLIGLDYSLVKKMGMEIALANGFGLEEKYNNELSAINEAIADYSKAIEIEPKNATAYILRQKIPNNILEYIFSADRTYYPIDNRSIDCVKALAIDPENAESFFLIIDNNGFNEADSACIIDAIIQVSKHSPKYSEKCYNELLENIPKIRNRDLAFAYYVKAFEINPDALLEKRNYIGGNIKYIAADYRILVPEKQQKFINIAGAYKKMADAQPFPEKILNILLNIFYVNYKAILVSLIGLVIVTIIVFLYKWYKDE